jgi:hypothetical protein
LIGYAFKADTNLCVGSAALLVESILMERGHRVFKYDPLVEGARRDLTVMEPHVFLLGTKHTQFQTLQLPKASILLDPWRYVKSAGDQVRVIPIGCGPNARPD